jgi:hypothetical protein
MEGGFSPNKFMPGLNPEDAEAFGEALESADLSVKPMIRNLAMPIPRTMPTTRTEIEYEIHCDGECVAMTFGEKAEEEAWHYANLYAQDGEVKVYHVTKIIEPIG